jgi:hypothetical protein
LAVAVLGVFLMASITGLVLDLVPWTATWPPSDSSVVISMLLVRLHGHFAAAMILVFPMVIVRAVLLRRGSSKYAVLIMEVAAFVALAIALWDPTSLLPWREIPLSPVLSLFSAPDPPPVLHSPFCGLVECERIDTRELLTAGRHLYKALRMRFWFFHAVLVPLALIAVGAVFINWRRSAINERRDSKG